MSETLVRLEDWLITSQEGEDLQLVAPEARPRCLWGEAFGHPSFTDGARIRTSDIVSVEGTTVVCRTRSYTLGKPHESYLQYLERHGESYDPVRPIPPGL